MNDVKTIQSIENTFKILDFINTHSDNGINAITNGVNLPKTTVHRITHTLLLNHIIIRQENGTFQLGHKLAEYTVRNSYSDTLIQIANPFMKECSLQLGETINLGSLFNNQSYIIHSVQGKEYLLQMKPRMSSPLHCSGSGKVFLYSLNDEEMEAYFQNSLTKFTDNTIVDLESMRIELNHSKDQQLFFDNEEYEYGLFCVATPIWNAANEIVASLSVSGPKGRLLHIGIDNLGEILKESANQISQSLKNNQL